MCGILGVVGESISADRLHMALRVIKHRGPDGCGVFVDAESDVALAHARLAIIDLETGDQPLFSEDNTIVLVCNGEIYDFKSHRRHLEQGGFRFRTNSDSEVIIYLYLKYGLDFLNLLRGEYAFLLFDRRVGQVIAARDRFGVKPLYYARTPAGILFGSEAKAIFATGLVEPELDVTAIRDLLSFVSVDTVFAGIDAIPPGGYMCIDVRSGRSDLRRYWDLDLPREDHVFADLDFDEHKEALRASLTDAVATRLQADVPVGAYLSGGVDSAAVAGTMRQLRPGKLDLFSIAFTEDARFNEAKQARRVAERLDAEYHEVEATTTTLLANLEASIWHSELPAANCNGVGKFLLSRLAGRHVKVVLTGEGGDELFLGYDYFRSREAMTLTQELLGRPTPIVRQKNGSHVGDMLDALGFVPQQEMTRLFSPTMQFLLRHLFHPDHRCGLDETSPLDRLRRSIVRSETDGRFPVSQLQYFSIRGILAPHLLSKLGDRPEMAHSVEGRTPLLDHMLFDLSREIPFMHKIHQGMEKYILREAVRDRVPEEICNRRKWPFFAPPIPVTHHGHATMAGLVETYLTRDAIRDAGLFDWRTVGLLRTLRRSGTKHGALAKILDSLLLHIMTVQILHTQFIRDRATRFGPGRI